MASGVVHQDPQDVICSQAPPFAVVATASNAMAAPVLAIVNTCGSGFAPPTGFVNEMGFTCSNTLLPTAMTTGIVAVLPAD